MERYGKRYIQKKLSQVVNILNFGGNCLVDMVQKEKSELNPN